MSWVDAAVTGAKLGISAISKPDYDKRLTGSRDAIGYADDSNFLPIDYEAEAARLKAQGLDPNIQAAQMQIGQQQLQRINREPLLAGMNAQRAGGQAFSGVVGAYRGAPGNMAAANAASRALLSSMNNVNAGSQQAAIAERAGLMGQANRTQDDLAGSQLQAMTQRNQALAELYRQRLHGGLAREEARVSEFGLTKGGQ